MSRYDFYDPVNGRTMVLQADSESETPYDGTHGVIHDGCDRLADVSPELDAWFCPQCHASGRISGALFMAVWTGDFCRCDDHEPSYTGGLCDTCGKPERRGGEVTDGK